MLQAQELAYSSFFQRELQIRPGPKKNGLRHGEVGEIYCSRIDSCFTQVAQTIGMPSILPRRRNISLAVFPSGD